MRVLSTREAATCRAALALWQREARVSPALAYTATDGNLFQPLDSDEVEEQLQALKRVRVCVSEAHTDMESLIRSLAASSQLDVGFNGYEEFLDQAQEIVARLEG